jgi:hypothetical protein
MSLRNRARSLQKLTGLSYQRALAQLRALGEKPAKLSKETGWPLDVCDRFLTDGHAPIDVIEVPEARSFREQCEAICETLRLTANARAVVLAAKNGAVLVQVGAFDVGAIWGATVRARQREDVWEMGENLVFHSANVRGARLVVVFERDKSSLGLVKLRARHAVEELERLFARAEGPAGMPPPSGRGGPGGLPAEVRVARDPLDPPKPKKKR